jgi:hypothetical protein
VKAISTEPGISTRTVCYRHPGRETAVSCSNCERPICTDCMVYTPVGIKCPDCARLPRSAIVRLRPNRAARAIASAAVGGLVLGLGILLLQAAVGLWTYVVPYGFFYGVDLGDVARNGSLAWVVIGAAIACYVAYQRTR